MFLFFFFWLFEFFRRRRRGRADRKNGLERFLSCRLKRHDHERGCLTMNTRRFEDLFYRFSLRPSLFICERFFLRSDVIRPLFKHILWRFQQIFYRTFSCSSWQFKASVPYPGWVRRGREPSTPRRALSCLNDIATMSASYLALSCREHVLPLRQQNSLARKSVNSSSAFRGIGTRGEDAWLSPCSSRASRVPPSR